jgi:hypothetical protein
VCNHPKKLLVSADETRTKFANKLVQAEGSEFATARVIKEMVRG